MPALRVAVADDGALFREGLVMLLQAAGYEVVASCERGDELVELARDIEFDVAILDIRMPPGINGGMRTAQLLRSVRPDVGLLLLSQYAEVEYLSELMQITTTGVGYRLKELIGSVQVLTDTLRRISDGELVVEPALAARWFGPAAPERPARLAALTSRESDVLRLMAEGRSNGSIAEDLHVSVKAIEKSTAVIFRKLRLTEDPQAHRRVLAVLTYLRGDQSE